MCKCLELLFVSSFSLFWLFCLPGKPVNSLFVSPAVTPIKNVLELYSNNPGFRMYLYNSQDYSMLVRRLALQDINAKMLF